MPVHQTLQRPRDDDPPPATPPKATLFCPDCGHTAPFDGDWTERNREYGVAIHCPTCDARLTLRPAYDDDVPDVVHAD